MMNFFDSKSIEDYVIQSRSMSDPPLSEIDFKNNVAWVWTTLKQGMIHVVHMTRHKNAKILVSLSLRSVESASIVNPICKRKIECLLPVR